MPSCLRSEVYAFHTAHQPWLNPFIARSSNKTCYDCSEFQWNEVYRHRNFVSWSCSQQVAAPLNFSEKKSLSNYFRSTYHQNTSNAHTTHQIIIRNKMTETLISVTDYPQELHVLQCQGSSAGQWSIQWRVWRGSWCASGFCPLAHCSSCEVYDDVEGKLLPCWW